MKDARAVFDAPVGHIWDREKSLSVCSGDGGVLTLISVPLNVRSGSVSVRKVGTVYLGFRAGMGWFPVEKGWRSSAGRASDL